LIFSFSISSFNIWLVENWASRFSKFVDFGHWLRSQV
jgi:hypothetical protein